MSSAMSSSTRSRRSWSARRCRSWSARFAAEIELYAIEGASGVVDYRYVMVENRTLVIDPVTREIVDVIY